MPMTITNGKYLISIGYFLGGIKLSRIPIIIILFTLLFIYGCTFNSEKSTDLNSTSEKVVYNGNLSDLQTLNEQEETIIFGLTDESSINSKQIIHKIKQDEIYTPNIYIKNNLSEASTYRIFFFKNYIQTEVLINDKKTYYLDLNLDVGEEESFSVQFLSVEEGLNDILVFAVRDPDNTLENPQYVDSSQVYISRRVALISGNYEKEPVVDYKHISTTAGKSESFFTDPFITLVGNNSFSTLINKEDIPNSKINMGSDLKDKRFAFISLMDNQQIFLNEFSYVQTDSIGNFQYTIDYNFDNHVPKNLIIIFIENPFSLDESHLLTEGVRFTNLITVYP